MTSCKRLAHWTALWVLRLGIIYAFAELGRHTLKASGGSSIEWLDMLVGALCAGVGATLVTIFERSQARRERRGDSETSDGSTTAG
jgi:hypothetical protein